MLLYWQAVALAGCTGRRHRPRLLFWQALALTSKSGILTGMLLLWQVAPAGCTGRLYRQAVALTDCISEKLNWQAVWYVVAPTGC